MQPDRQADTGRHNYTGIIVETYEYRLGRTRERQTDRRTYRERQRDRVREKEKETGT